MATHPVPLLVDAVIRMARRQCEAKQCGAEAKWPGSRNKHLRCRDCPQDDVDRLVDMAYED